MKLFSRSLLLAHCHWCCAEHDISADGEEINDKSSTPVRHSNSLRTRRHHVARREPSKEANKASDDTVGYYRM